MELCDEMAEENLNSGKEKWITWNQEFIPHKQTPKEGIKYLDEIRIRFIVCLSFIKLNWWQAMDFAYYLFFLKRIEKWHIANLRRSSWTTGRIEKNKWINMITKNKESEGTTVTIRTKDWWKRMNHREELEEPICSRGFRCKRTKRSWAD